MQFSGLLGRWWRCGRKWRRGRWGAISVVWDCSNRNGTKYTLITRPEILEVLISIINIFEAWDFTVFRQRCQYHDVYSGQFEQSSHEAIEISDIFRLPPCKCDPLGIETLATWGSTWPRANAIWHRKHPEPPCSDHGNLPWAPPKSRAAMHAMWKDRRRHLIAGFIWGMSCFGGTITWFEMGFVWVDMIQHDPGESGSCSIWDRTGCQRWKGLVVW